MAIDFSQLSSEQMEALIHHPLIVARTSVTAADRAALDALESTDYYLSDWFWTGATEIRLNPKFPFQPQGRKEYARVRADANIPPDEIEQYKALFLCIAGTAAVNVAFAAALSVPITLPVALAIVVTIAVACFSQNSITMATFQAAISEVYLEKRWGDWG